MHSFDMRGRDMGAQRLGLGVFFPLKFTSFLMSGFIVFEIAKDFSLCGRNVVIMASVLIKLRMVPFNFH